jgi:hypothetical protein
MRLLLASLIGIATTLGMAGDASAWGPSGHMLVADLAYRQLGTAERAKALAILKAAFDNTSGQGLAQFEADLTQGLPATATAAEKDRSIFLRAAIWPDIIRDEGHPCHKEFHKPLWHFINLPFVVPGDTIAKPADPVPTPPGMEPRDVLSAITLCISDVKAAGTTPRVRAARLCFLLHTVGDIHQPLHASALFSSDKLPAGDEGGNKMLVRFPGHGAPGDRVTSIHAIFDELFGRDTRLKTIDALGDSIEKDPHLSRISLAAALKDADPMDWAKESLANAVKFAYKDGTLDAFRGLSVKEFNKKHLDPDDVPAVPVDYESNALPVADVRVALAGFRLADILAPLLR